MYHQSIFEKDTIDKALVATMHVRVLRQKKSADKVHYPFNEIENCAGREKTRKTLMNRTGQNGNGMHRSTPGIDGQMRVKG